MLVRILSLNNFVSTLSDIATGHHNNAADIANGFSNAIDLTNFLVLFVRGLWDHACAGVDERVTAVSFSDQEAVGMMRDLYEAMIAKNQYRTTLATCLFDAFHDSVRRVGASCVDASSKEVLASTEVAFLQSLLEQLHDSDPMAVGRAITVAFRSSATHGGNTDFLLAFIKNSFANDENSCKVALVEGVDGGSMALVPALANTHKEVRQKAVETFANSLQSLEDGSSQQRFMVGLLLQRLEDQEETVIEAVLGAKNLWKKYADPTDAAKALDRCAASIISRNLDLKTAWNLSAAQEFLSAFPLLNRIAECAASISSRDSSSVPTTLRALSLLLPNLSKETAAGLSLFTNESRSCSSIAVSMAKNLKCRRHCCESLAMLLAAVEGFKTSSPTIGDLLDALAAARILLASRRRALKTDVKSDDELPVASCAIIEAALQFLAKEGKNLTDEELDNLITCLLQLILPRPDVLCSALPNLVSNKFVTPLHMVSAALSSTNNVEIVNALTILSTRVSSFDQSCIMPLLLLLISGQKTIRQAVLNIVRKISVMDSPPCAATSSSFKALPIHIACVHSAALTKACTLDDALLSGFVSKIVDQEAEIMQNPLHFLDFLQKETAECDPRVVAFVVAYSALLASNDKLALAAHTVLDNVHVAKSVSAFQSCGVFKATSVPQSAATHEHHVLSTVAKSLSQIDTAEAERCKGDVQLFAREVCLPAFANAAKSSKNAAPVDLLDDEQEEGVEDAEEDGGDDVAENKKRDIVEPASAASSLLGDLLAMATSPSTLAVFDVDLQVEICCAVLAATLSNQTITSQTLTARHALLNTPLASQTMTALLSKSLGETDQNSHLRSNSGIQVLCADVIRVQAVRYGADLLSAGFLTTVVDSIKSCKSTINAQVVPILTAALISLVECMVISSSSSSSKNKYIACVEPTLEVVLDLAKRGALEAAVVRSASASNLGAIIPLAVSACAAVARACYGMNHSVGAGKAIAVFESCLSFAQKKDTATIVLNGALLTSLRTALPGLLPPQSKDEDEANAAARVETIANLLNMVHERLCFKHDSASVVLAVVDALGADCALAPALLLLASTSTKESLEQTSQSMQDIANGYSAEDQRACAASLGKLLSSLLYGEKKKACSSINSESSSIEQDAMTARCVLRFLDGVLSGKPGLPSNLDCDDSVLQVCTLSKHLFLIEIGLSQPKWGVAGIKVVKLKAHASALQTSLLRALRNVSPVAMLRVALFSLQNDEPLDRRNQLVTATLESLAAVLSDPSSSVAQKSGSIDQNANNVIEDFDNANDDYQSDKKRSKKTSKKRSTPALPKQHLKYYSSLIQVVTNRIKIDMAATGNLSKNIKVIVAAFVCLEKVVAAVGSELKTPLADNKCFETVLNALELANSGNANNQLQMIAAACTFWSAAVRQLQVGALAEANKILPKLLTLIQQWQQHVSQQESDEVQDKTKSDEEAAHVGSDSKTIWQMVDLDDDDIWQISPVQCIAQGIFGTVDVLAKFISPEAPKILFCATHASLYESPAQGHEHDEEEDNVRRKRQKYEIVKTLLWQSATMVLRKAPLLAVQQSLTGGVQTLTSKIIEVAKADGESDFLKTGVQLQKMIELLTEFFKHASPSDLQSQSAHLEKLLVYLAKLPSKVVAAASKASSKESKFYSLSDEHGDLAHIETAVCNAFAQYVPRFPVAHAVALMDKLMKWVRKDRQHICGLVLEKDNNNTSTCGSKTTMATGAISKGLGPAQITAEAAAGAITFYKIVDSVCHEAQDVLSKPFLPKLTRDLMHTLTMCKSVAFANAKVSKKRKVADEKKTQVKSSVWWWMPLSHAALSAASTGMTPLNSIGRDFQDDVFEPVSEFVGVLSFAGGEEYKIVNVLRPCLVNCMRLSNSDAQGRIIITGLLRNTKKKNPATVIAALRLCENLWQQLGVAMLSTLSDVLLFVVERLEDESEDVERAARCLVKTLESVTGESLSEHLRT